MSCFLVPATEAVVTTIVTKVVRKSEDKVCHETGKIAMSEKLGWLNKMLWGGSALLCFEHLWHGEVSPLPPFLTAAADAASTSEMLHEMATSGVAMAALVTLVWAGMVGVSRLMKRRALPAETEETV